VLNNYKYIKNKEEDAVIKVLFVVTLANRYSASTLRPVADKHDGKMSFLGIQNRVIPIRNVDDQKGQQKKGIFSAREKANCNAKCIMGLQPWANIIGNSMVGIEENSHGIDKFYFYGPTCAEGGKGVEAYISCSELHQIFFPMF
jgi:hypothetical protein